MELAKQKFDRLLEERDMIDKHGVCVRVLGDLSMLPDDLQRSIARAVNFSKHNTRHVLNVCMAYTSRHEICEAIKTMAKAVEDGALKPMDISENVLDQCLYTHQSPEPDLLIRTSGEVRFSDFLLWQCSYTSLSFLKVLWPEFSVWNFYSAILSYQWNFTAIQKIRQDAQKDKIHKEMEADLEVVLNELRAENVCVSNGSSSSNGSGSHYEELMRKPALKARVEKYQDKKRERIERFLSGLDELRTDYLHRMCTVQN
ncbi:dehydrodolichyl diphosphate synthase complex subunit DHDDS isoform X2 [Nematostella vectensis]|nr:dehydrodolichyl diphosphate synthase complex subunit DHDDS isoform X2 [Nematostella vectensis]